MILAEIIWTFLASVDRRHTRQLPQILRVDLQRDFGTRLEDRMRPWANGSTPSWRERLGDKRELKLREASIQSFR